MTESEEQKASPTLWRHSRAGGNPEKRLWKRSVEIVRYRKGNPKWRDDLY